MINLTSLREPAVSADDHQKLQEEKSSLIEHQVIVPAQNRIDQLIREYARAEITVEMPNTIEMAPLGAVATMPSAAAIVHASKSDNIAKSVQHVILNRRFFKK